MGSKCVDMPKINGTYSHRVISVTLVKGQVGAAEPGSSVVLTVQNDWDTLKFVKENIDDIAANLVMVKQMNAQHRVNVDDSAKLFQKHLEPLFALVSATSTEHIMDKLSTSLKKALLLMAMERYNCDSDSICRALGISKVKLEKELKHCGLPQEARSAA